MNNVYFIGLFLQSAMLLKYIFVPLSTVVCGKWGFYIVLHFKNSFICFGICKRKKKEVRCDLVDNKITTVLNSIMAFSF